MAVKVIEGGEVQGLPALSLFASWDGSPQGGDIFGSVLLHDSPPVTYFWSAEADQK